MLIFIIEACGEIVNLSFFVFFLNNKFGKKGDILKNEKVINFFKKEC